jgi:hypothetical protein
MRLHTPGAAWEADTPNKRTSSRAWLPWFRARAVTLCATMACSHLMLATGQFRLCREYAKRQGWQLVESYSD